MSLSICSVGAANGEDISICFEWEKEGARQRERFVISAAQFASLGLSCGDCPRETYDSVAYAARVHAALRKGLLMLGYGACSSGRLRRKLIAKGIHPEIAAEAVDILLADGYLCDGDNAQREAEKGVAKGWGKRRILSSLYDKGYSDGAVRSAMLSLEDAEIDFVSMCAEQMARRLSALPETPEERQKLFAAMARLGYSTSEIKEAYGLFVKQLR